jgi:pyruvate dehydrogenase phosphatase
MGTSWTFFGLFDGFNGGDNKDYIAHNLISIVLDALANLVSTQEPPTTEHVEIGMGRPHDFQTPSEEPYSDAVNRKIKETFLQVDNAVVHQSVDVIFSSSAKAAAMKPLSLALSGTSALVSFYDLDTRLLKIAHAGNSRAVLGRRKHGDQRFSYYEVHVLAADQAPKNPAELTTHARSGSNESSLTRAFGLAAYKWNREIQERVHQDYLGDPPTPNIKMHPYLTAEPEITTIEVKPGDFLIMASAGLWNSLTSEEAVGLVGLWLDRGMYQAAESRFTPTETTTPPAAAPTSDQIIHPNDLPVSLGAKDETVMYRRWGAEKRFVCVDINAAGHLTRNALGGADGDLTDALLSVEPPRSRKLRFVTSYARDEH